MDAPKIMGFENPGDQKFKVSLRDWNATKLAMWRGKTLSDIVVRQALELVGHCRHSPGCPGSENETEPCFSSTLNEDGSVKTPGCPDRELRMSALVILNAARQLSPVDARRPSDPFYAPSREYYSELIAEFMATQLENEMLRRALQEAGVEPPSPPATQAEAPPQIGQS